MRIPPHTQEELGVMEEAPVGEGEGPHKTGLGPTHLPVSLHLEHCEEKNSGALS